MTRMRIELITSAICFVSPVHGDAFRAAWTRIANMQVSMSAYLRPDQKAVLVPQAWVPAKQSDNSSAVADFKMAGNTLRHLAWGMEDERVAAIIPFALGCGHALPAVTCAWNFWGKELMDEAMVTRFYQAFSAGFAPRLPPVDPTHSQ